VRWQLATPRFGTRLGVIVPSSNTNLEPDVIGLLPSGAWAHFNRIGEYAVDSVPDLSQLRELATGALESRVRELRAAGADVIAYGCTSASYAMGTAFDHELTEAMESWSSLPAVTAARGIVEAISALAVGRVGLASPYEAGVHEAAISFLETAGVQVVASAFPGRPLTNREQGEFAPADVVALARHANVPAAEAVVLSCTDMRAVELVETLEAEFGKPVITSNQALVWAALSRASVTAEVMPRCGALMSSHWAMVRT
jgi:maleate isomerase